MAPSSASSRSQFTKRTAPVPFGPHVHWLCRAKGVAFHPLVPAPPPSKPRGYAALRGPRLSLALLRVRTMNSACVPSAPAEALLQLSTAPARALGRSCSSALGQPRPGSLSGQAPHPPAAAVHSTEALPACLPCLWLSGSRIPSGCCRHPGRFLHRGRNGRGTCGRGCAWRPPCSRSHWAPGAPSLRAASPCAAADLPMQVRCSRALATATFPPSL